MKRELRNVSASVYQRLRNRARERGEAVPLVHQRYAAERLLYLVTTLGSIGRCAIVPSDAGPGILHPCVLRIQPDPEKVIGEFLSLLIQDSALMRGQLLLGSNATTIDVIYSDTMSRVSVTQPPLIEQQAIVAWVRERAKDLNQLVGRVGDAIERLKEHRTALISAAVTGKIDVREEVT